MFRKTVCPCELDWLTALEAAPLNENLHPGAAKKKVLG